MLTYDLSDVKGSLYQYLYECIKADILKGKLVSNEKMPSKRSLAQSFQMSQLFASGGQSIGVSALASVLPMDTQD